MRSILSCCLAAGAAALFLTACEPGETRVERGTQEGILHWGNGAEPQGLDPHLVTGVPEHMILAGLFEGLVIMDPETLEPLPGVAESWDISEDDLVYTFHLRDDARWSNGDPVTAHDFVYAWNRILAPELGSEYAYMLHCIENAEAYNEGDLDDFGEVGVQALDDQTLEVTLEDPTPYFLALQIHYTFYPVHQDTIEAFGAMDERGTEWTRAGNMVSNGPFELTEWQPNQVIRTKANEHYWDAGTVQLNGVNFYPIDDLQTEERSFRNGELHWTGDMPINRIDWYRKNRPEVLEINPYLGTYYFRFNVTRPPLDDARVRRAFAMAIDREGIVENITRGDEQPAAHLTPPDTEGFLPGPELPYDVERAQELLAEAGYPDGEGLPSVDLLYNTSENHRIIAQAIQNMWRNNLGAKVNLLNQEWTVYLSSMSNLNYDIARAGWIGDVNDPINFLECFVTDGGNNRTGYSSEEYDSLIAAARREADPQRRSEILREAETILMEDAPIAPLYFYTRKNLRSPDLRGFEPNIRGYVNYKFLYLEAEDE
ncbi:MAG: peptide ABC transporter substrate-binding protein [Candidatus Hydrogenedentota bacterium]